MISRFHYITQEVPGFSHPQLADIACRSGADWIQLRVKKKPLEEWLAIAAETAEVCKRFGARLIVNDNPHVAAAVRASGVHLGREDMDPAEARRILGSDSIIGGTTNSVEDILRMVRSGIDYVGLGPYRFTTTKEKLSPVLGLEGIRKIMHELGRLKINIPVVAIGGIQVEDVESLLSAGAHGIAVSSAVNLAENRAEAVHRILQSCEAYL